MKIYKVTFKWSKEGSTYCSNIAKAESLEDVKAYYEAKYSEVFIEEGSEADIEEANRKNKPIIEIETKPEAIVDIQEAIDELKEYMSDTAIEAAVEMFDYCESDYIGDCINEICDGMVDIYYSNLINWIQEGDNVAALQEVIDEGLYDPSSNYNLWDHIRCAQYSVYYNEVCGDMEEVIELFALKHLLKSTDTIGAKMYEAIIDELEALDNNDKIGHIIDAVENCIDPDYEE